MTRRIDKTWTVLTSIESEDGLYCVDLFRRADGTFGYEEFRRDPEDGGAWTPVRFASGLVFGSIEGARAAARTAIAWLTDTSTGVQDTRRFLGRL
jgi:hypothetical protein